MSDLKVKNVADLLSKLSNPVRVAEENQTLSLKTKKSGQKDGNKTLTMPNAMLAFPDDGGLASNKTITRAGVMNSTNKSIIGEMKEYPLDVILSSR